MKRDIAKYLCFIFFCLFFPHNALAQSPAIKDTENNLSDPQTTNSQQELANSVEPGSQRQSQTAGSSCIFCQAPASFDLWTPFTNLFAVALGALIGGYISYIMQNSKTRFEISRSLMDWKIKQLAELYGPLYALLHQSNAIYRQMNLALSNADPAKFRLEQEDTGTDFDNKVFQIFEDNEWKFFRTITHFDHVYGAKYGVETYFDELVSIGERIAKVVEEKAGFVRDDQRQLADIFGKYLAHFTVLRQLHSKRRDNLNAPNENDRANHGVYMPVDITAAFPREILHLVREGFDKLNTELNNWSRKGNC